MSKLQTIIIAFVLFSSVAQAGSSDAAGIDENNFSKAKHLRAILQQPEDKIDIGLIALTLAKEFNPSVDVAAYSHKIDSLVEEARWLAQGTQDPEQRIRVLNTVIFRREGFHYDRTPNSRSKQEYYFLTTILDTKQGICYTMPLLYLAIAQRLGYPIYPVIAPDHLFLRYIEPGFPFQNIEVTSGGKYIPDDKYIKDFGISPLGMKSGSYLRTLSYREFLGEIISANANIYARRGKLTKAIEYFEAASRLNPKSADHYNNLAASYKMQSESLTGDAATSALEKAAKNSEKAKALGFVSDEDIAKARKRKGDKTS